MKNIKIKITLYPIIIVNEKQVSKQIFCWDAVDKHEKHFQVKALQIM